MCTFVCPITLILIMSIEFHKNTLESQTDCIQSQQDVIAEDNIMQSKFNKWGRIRFVVLLTIVAILVVAIIKNPSSTETKALIKDAIVEKVYERLDAELMYEDNSEYARFGSFMGKAIAPHILDYFANINVSDYIVFSTFVCTSKYDNVQTKNIVSGVVVFGKVIPLKSDLNSEALELD